MTVCLAGIAENRTEIIAVSDRRLTYGDIAADVETVEKAFQIHPRWIAMFAGNDIGNIRPILDRVRLHLATIASKEKRLINRVDVAREFRGAFRAHHRTLIEEKVLAPFDLSVRDFQQKGFHELGPTAFDDLRHAVQAVKVDCDFLVCGFSSNEPQIFTISDSGLSYYDLIGYWSIGSGAWSAISSLAFRKFHLNLPFQEALYQILEAKFMADTAVPTVGKATYTLVLNRDGQIGHIPEHDVQNVRRIWEREGQPRTPKDLNGRMPPVVFSMPSAPATSHRPAARQAHRDSRRGRKS